jgi:hypothetical protein
MSEPDRREWLLDAHREEQRYNAPWQVLERERVRREMGPGVRRDAIDDIFSDWSCVSGAYID